MPEHVHLLMSDAHG